MISPFIASAALTALLLGGNAQGQGLLKSGPPVGAPNDRSGFYPKWVAGFCAKQHICPV
jgi:hypothetical protein